MSNLQCTPVFTGDSSEGDLSGAESEGGAPLHGWGTAALAGHRKWSTQTTRTR